MKHDLVDGLYVDLRVDNIPLEEFEGDEELYEGATSTSTRYVEVVSGANFTVNIKVDKATFPHIANDFNCSVFMDGKCATSRLVSSLRYTVPAALVDGVIEGSTGNMFLRKFMFSELRTGDGPVAPSLVQELKELGTVSVRLTRCVKTAYKGSGSERRESFQSAGGETVPEKSLKGRAISNRASLGGKQKCNSSWGSAEYPWGTVPFAIFNFKYRSHKDLQIEGIIERSPSPAPLEERDPETLTAAELRELLRRRNEELENLAQVKREGVKRERSRTIIDDDGDDEVSILDAGPSKRRRTAEDSAIDIVDLTED